MADAEYTHGTMEIEEQKRTWEGFMTGTLWGGFAITLILAYATFALAIGMNWMVSLVLVAGLGIIGGLAMGMGGAWIATVIGLSAIAVLVQIFIALFSLLS